MAHPMQSLCQDLHDQPSKQSQLADLQDDKQMKANEKLVGLACCSVAN
jgi:hypothetical protein